MKIKFKEQEYQTKAVESVVNCFKGQPRINGVKFLVDPGDITLDEINQVEYLPDGIKNANIELSSEQILENINNIQESSRNLQKSKSLLENNVAKINLEVEMETGTGKTYVYIKTMFELYEKYGWSKFMIVVPSIAIREGVYKSFELTRQHFQEKYSKQIRAFIYDSSNLQQINDYCTDDGINVMIINFQAYNTTAKRIIHNRFDRLGSRRPIDLIKSTKPIVIIDEPQKLNSKKNGDTKSFQLLKEFKPLFILGYSATHEKVHNKIHKLDAIDAYTMKLVKKIQVRSISIKGTTGSGYIYLQEITITNDGPVAKVEIEMKRAKGISKKTISVSSGDSLYSKSNKLEQYKDLRIRMIDKNKEHIELSNNEVISTGEAIGNIEDSWIRRLQIRETIKAHLEKELVLFSKGIKVLSLFFIDKVSNYRDYERDDLNGIYARYFEEEYQKAIEEVIKENPEEKEYLNYVNSIDVKETHNGYFAQDNKTRFKDITERNTKDSKPAYDLILKDKELLLNLNPHTSPVRFIFSHSALREGWDNPNVFVLCTLKKAINFKKNETPRRQEIGRGLRISVDRNGNRTDGPDVHDINILTIVTDENFRDYANGLQKEIMSTLTDRQMTLNEEFFLNKKVKSKDGKAVYLNESQANLIEYWLIMKGFVDKKRELTDNYWDADKKDLASSLPEELDLYRDSIIEVIEKAAITNNKIKQMVLTREDELMQETKTLRKVSFKNYEKK